MFDRFIRLAKAKKALRDQRFEEALQLATDPVVADDRRADDLRTQAREQLLTRANRRLDEGDDEGAAAIVRRLQALAAHPAQAALEQRIEVHRRERGDQQAAAKRGLAEVRSLLARGALRAAEELLAQRGAHLMPAEVRGIEKELAVARQRARENLAAASACLRRGDLVAAESHWRRAAALDDGVEGLLALRQELQPLMLGHLQALIDAALRRGDPAGAMSLWRTHATAAGVFDAAQVEGLVTRLREALGAALRSADLGAATALARSADEFPAGEPLDELIAALRHADSLANSVEVDAAWEAVAAGAAKIGAKQLQQAAHAAAAKVRHAGGKLAEAKAAVAGGDLERAAASLRALLAEQPVHEAARRELEVVEQGLRSQQDRLDVARTAARRGNLAQAAAHAAALVGPSRVGSDAAAVLADIRARMALVDRGVDEIRVALHGRAACGIEGVRHCLRRLEALREVQQDHLQVQRLQQAVQAEISGLELCEEAKAAADRGDLAALATALEQWLPLRSQLMAEDRLDARFAELADRLHGFAEAQVARGDVSAAERAAELLAQLAGLDELFVRRAHCLREAVSAARQQARELAKEARHKLAQSDVGEAERLCAAAAALAGDLAEVRSLRAELADLGRQEAVLQRVAALADERDFGGAQQKLAELQSTPALLRTRIYDMKQSLAKAQGLEGAFLLRVDEGGECLVLRGESVSIGNVRQTRADLPVLASLAGRHATIRRTLSFHGGMQDMVVADEGTVAVDGEAVDQRALRSGDRVQLGSALAFVYSQPSARSLSAMLQLQGGFQVAGTDRIVLMKDRGKDGRLLLGPGRDSHVRVGNATGEVELFATNTGQVRVACAAGGKIDGAPFRGEHPVDAGQVVEAGGISFVLLPWRAGA